jgi:hypothetical protein
MRRSSYTAAVIRTQRFAFQRRGPKRLALRFSAGLLGGGDWEEVEIRMDAVAIGRATPEMLREGVEYRLFDDSLLRMWLESAPSGPPLLNITRNGHPLPGSQGDPLYSVRSMVVMLWVFAAIQILAEVVVIIPTDRRHEEFAALQTDYWVTGVGVIVVLLCILAWRRSVAALIAACVLFAGQLLLFFALHPSLYLLSIGLFPMIGLVWFMLRSIRAALDLQVMRLPIRRASPSPAGLNR